MSNVDPQTSLEDRKKLVTEALEGTDKKPEKIESKDGDRDFKVHFAKAEKLQLFLNKWHKKKYRNSSGAPIYGKKTTDPRLRAIEAPMVKINKQIRVHYFATKKQHKVTNNEASVSVDGQVVVRLHGGRLDWQDEELKQLFGADDDLEMS